MTTAEALAFEAAMLDVLASATEGANIKANLLAHPGTAGARAWIERCEPRMLEVGASLVKQWGRKR